MSAAQGAGVLALLLLTFAAGSAIAWGLYRLEEKLYRRNLARFDALIPPRAPDYRWSDLAAEYRRNFPEDGQ